MEVISHSSTFLLPAKDQPDPSLCYVLIILNQGLPRFTPLLWDHAQFYVCADGGANRLFDEIPHFFPEEDADDVRKRYKPDVIIGDFDSVRPEVLDYYANLGTKDVNQARDQDTTDLHKCCNYIIGNEVLDTSKICILVTGALGGRFDHEAGNINILYTFPEIRIVLLSDDSLLLLLLKSRDHEIHIQSSVEGPHCGLIPFGTTSSCTFTTGLEYPLDGKTEMKLGGLISTSNLVVKDKVTVRSDSDLVWTISIKKP